MLVVVYGPIMEDDENKIYVFGSHQYALYYWVRALLAQTLAPNAQLIHIDHHTDFLPPRVKKTGGTLPILFTQKRLIVSNENKYFPSCA